MEATNMKFTISAIVMFSFLFVFGFQSVADETIPEFKPKLMEVKINDDVLFKDGKVKDKNIDVKDLWITIEYTFKNTGTKPAKTKWRVFAIFKDKANKSVVGNIFWPNRSTTKWKPGYVFVQKNKVKLPEAAKGQKLDLRIGMFKHGRIKLANPDIELKNRSYQSGSITVAK